MMMTMIVSIPLYEHQQRLSKVAMSSIAATSCLGDAAPHHKKSGLRTKLDDTSTSLSPS